MVSDVVKTWEDMFHIYPQLGHKNGPNSNTRGNGLGNKDRLRPDEAPTPRFGSYLNKDSFILRQS